ncbi:DUF2510 domain-containing protein [Actinomadura geliboluensis]|uniref:DUF2510 domain-containing protein n=1 Tax=Actinomadura geliboluensis TaxID=882440 RepID=UPI003692BC0D
MHSEPPGPGSPPGWYPDPESLADQARWWSGTHWTGPTKLRSSPASQLTSSSRRVMIVLTILLAPALALGAAGFSLISSPSDPCEHSDCNGGPGAFELAGVGLGACGIALVAILLAWRSRRLSPQGRIGSLTAGLVLTILWLTIWFARLF